MRSGHDTFSIFSTEHSYEYFTIKSSSSGPDQPGHAQVLRQEEHWTPQHQEQDHGLSTHCHGSDKNYFKQNYFVIIRKHKLKLQDIWHLETQDMRLSDPSGLN